MGSRVVRMVEVISQDSAQVVFTDDDQMIETLSANRADDAFRVWIPSPVELEALPVPFDDGIRFDEDSLRRDARDLTI
jgi:hypothetical protein